MYLRFVASYYDEAKSSEGSGIFRAADYVKNNTNISDSEKESLIILIKWFDNNLPIPDFYQDPSRRIETKRFFWFKDGAKNFIDKMDKLIEILEANSVKVERIYTKELPGVIVFEDKYQVVIEKLVIRLNN